MWFFPFLIPPLITELPTAASSEDSDSESEMEVDENPNQNQGTPKSPSVTTTEKPKKVYCNPTGSKNIPSPMKK